MSHDFIEVPKKEAHATLCNFRLHLFQLLLRRINIKRNRRLVKRQEPLVFLYFGWGRGQCNLYLAILLILSLRQKRDVDIEILLRHNVFKIFLCWARTYICSRSKGHADVMKPFNLSLLKKLFVICWLNNVFEAVVSPDTKAVITYCNVPVNQTNIDFKFISLLRRHNSPNTIREAICKVPSAFSKGMEKFLHRINLSWNFRSLFHLFSKFLIASDVSVKLSHCNWKRFSHSQSQIKKFRWLNRHSPHFVHVSVPRRVLGVSYNLVFSVTKGHRVPVRGGWVYYI